MSAIDYKKLEESLRRLEERYIEYCNNKDSLKEFLIESMKESCIQRFEVCFDTLWKHLKKYLEIEHGMSDIPNSPNGIFKSAFSAKVLDEAELWIGFNNKRIATSHDYSGKKAGETFEILQDFIEEAIALYEIMTGMQWKKQIETR